MIQYIRRRIREISKIRYSHACCKWDLDFWVGALRAEDILGIMYNKAIVIPSQQSVVV
jgi:hypothetical protein